MFKFLSLSLSLLTATGRTLWLTPARCPPSSSPSFLSSTAASGEFHWINTHYSCHKDCGKSLVLCLLQKTAKSFYIYSVFAVAVTVLLKFKYVLLDRFILGCLWQKQQSWLLNTIIFLQKKENKIHRYIEMRRIWVWIFWHSEVAVAAEFYRTIMRHIILWW